MGSEEECLTSSHCSSVAGRQPLVGSEARTGSKVIHPLGSSVQFPVKLRCSRWVDSTAS